MWPQVTLKYHTMWAKAEKAWLGQSWENNTLQKLKKIWLDQR
jgi:hypothetical protein